MRPSLLDDPVFLAQDLLPADNHSQLCQQHGEPDPLRVPERQFPTHVCARVRLCVSGRRRASVEEDRTPAVRDDAG